MSAVRCLQFKQIDWLIHLDVCSQDHGWAQRNLERMQLRKGKPRYCHLVCHGDHSQRSRLAIFPFIPLLKMSPREAAF